MEFLKFNKSYAQADIANRIKFQSIVKHHVSKEYSAQKDRRQQKSVLSKVKKRLQNTGRHRMRWKIQKMRRDRKFPQMPGKRDKYRQYGFIPRIPSPVVQQEPTVSNVKSSQK